MSYRFSSGPAASNLYYTENGIEYAMTFDYSFSSLYFRKINSTLLNLDLVNGVTKINLHDNDKIVFKKMLERTILENKNFTFNNIPNLIEKLGILNELN